MIDPGLTFSGIHVAPPKGSEVFHARWHVPMDLPYFRGHFPGMPIFPAVGIVDASLHALGIHLQTSSPDLIELPTAKFLNPVLPGCHVILAFRRVSAIEWECEWSDQESNKTYSILRLITG